MVEALRCWTRKPEDDAMWKIMTCSAQRHKAWKHQDVEFSTMETRRSPFSCSSCVTVSLFSYQVHNEVVFVFDLRLQRISWKVMQNVNLSKRMYVGFYGIVFSENWPDWQDEKCDISLYRFSSSYRGQNNECCVNLFISFPVIFLRWILIYETFTWRFDCVGLRISAELYVTSSFRSILLHIASPKKVWHNIEKDVYFDRIYIIK